MRFSRLGVCSAVALLGLALAACFGDNSATAPDGGGGDGPSVVEIASADQVDQGDALDVTIKVKGTPEEQLTVAVDGTLGTFSPLSKIVIADADGEGSFVTRYTPGATGGAEVITANVSNLAGASKSATKTLTVYGVERLGNSVQVGPAAAQAAGFLAAYPMVLATDRVVRKLGILAPAQTLGATVDAQVGLYTSGALDSLNVLTKTTAKLVPGVNEIAIPPQALTAGTYWMVVAYDGAPLVYRSTTVNIQLRYKTTHVFANGLADRLDNMVLSQSTEYFIRSFYLVLRK